MSGARVLAYVAIYAITLLSQPEFYMVALTAPMFAVILFSLLFTRPDRIGYIDVLALLYFISFVIVPMQSAENFVFTSSVINKNMHFPPSWFETIMALAVFSYLALVAFLGPRRTHSPSELRSTIHISGGLLAAVALALALLAVLITGSVENLHSSRYDRETTDVAFLLPIVIAALSINAMFSLIRREPSIFVKYAVAAVTCGALLFVVNPWNTARFVLFGAWIPVILILLPSLLRPSRFYLAVPGVILVAMPVLSITTRYSTARSDLVATIFSDWQSLFRISFFDLFESACDGIRHVELYGHQWGGLFVSTVAAFVPRVWWPEKPINSGLLVGWMHVDEGGRNQNLAMSWFMDGYMDFGILGSLFYSVLLAIVFAAIRRHSKVVNGFDLTFLIFVANAAILMRGTLAVVYALMLFQLIFLWLYSRAFTRRVSAEADAQQRAPVETIAPNDTPRPAVAAREMPSRS